MHIQQINPEEKITQLALSVEMDQRSWKGWSALHIEAIDSEKEDFQDAVIMAAKPIIQSYFKDIEGSAYFCNHKDIYIVCKNTPQSVLNQALIDIRDLAFGENALSCNYWIYPDFGSEGREFAQMVFKTIDRPFVTSPCDIDQAIEEVTEDFENQDSNRKDDEPIKILLVEDDPVTRWMVSNSLKDECDVITADTAGKVFSSYDVCKPDIVLLDIGLPDNSGNEVLSWIMRNDPAARVVMLSSKDNVDNITSCIESGAKGFIPKPFVKENLMHYIHKYG